MGIEQVSNKSGIQPVRSAEIKRTDSGVKDLPSVSVPSAIPSMPSPPENKMTGWEKTGDAARGIHNGNFAGEIGEIGEKYKENMPSGQPAATDKPAIRSTSAAPVKDKNEEAKINKTLELLKTIKQYINKLDVKVEKDHILIGKPFPFRDEKIPLKKEKIGEARKLVDELVGKMKEGKEPTKEDAAKVLSLIDDKAIEKMMKG